MDQIVIRNARIVTTNGGTSALRGEKLDQLKVMNSRDVFISAGTIQRIAEHDPELRMETGDEVIDANGRVLMPSFVDCHTHACWAGERFEEWDQKLRGQSYQEILRQGGGIMSTVRAVRSADQSLLSDLLLKRLEQILRHGTATIEIKSGYGLNTVDELKMLRAIRDAATSWPGTIELTACLGHAIDVERVERSEFVRETIDATLPAVSEEFPGIAIDAYCEEGAWTVEECLELFEAAQRLGHPIRVHADQFQSLGMIDDAIPRRFLSVDHLEASDSPSLSRLAKSETFGVMLPCSGFQLDDRYGDGRSFVDFGGALAIASNYNPGSAPCASMQMAIALASRKLGLTPAESINAATINAAMLLGMSDRGRIEEGLRADLLLIEHEDERQLAYEFGSNAVREIICHGRRYQF